jgi:hypothetical protein
MHRFTCFLLLLSVALSLQTESAAQSLADNRTEALASLYAALSAKEAEIYRLRTNLQEAPDPVTRQGIEDQLLKRHEELRTLSTKFEEAAAGVDPTPFQDEVEEPFSWEQTLGEILEPIVAELEAATATSRKIAALKEDLSTFSEREAIATRALANLETTRSAITDPDLQTALDALLGAWQDRRLLASNQANAARLQLEEIEGKSGGIIGSTTPYIRDFLSQRGLNLLIGIVAALLVFFSLRFMLFLLRKIRGADNPHGLGSRLFLLLTNLLSIIGALAALLIAFSAAGDLFLLGIVLVFLIGAAWAGIQVVPQFIESLKIILNIGMVKENQRILFDGVPWQVDSLGFSCRLSNDYLDEAELILPVKRLVGLHSRPWCQDEPLFPSRRGEWVQLSDGSLGEILAQNPSTVTLQEPGGASKVFTTENYLALSPRSLSAGSFRFSTTFGIDYQHQAEAPSRILQLFQSALDEHLSSKLPEKSIQLVEVYFAGAGDSSLDYLVVLDLTEAAAPYHAVLKGYVHGILVDTCTANALTIPFPQLTVHRASS